MEKLSKIYSDVIKGTRFFDFTKFVDPLRHENQDNAEKVARETGMV